MAVKKINITIDEAMLDKFDKFASANGITRSGLLVLATNQYIDAKVKAPVAQSALTEFFSILADASKGGVNQTSLETRINELDDKVKALQNFDR